MGGTRLLMVVALAGLFAGCGSGTADDQGPAVTESAFFDGKADNLYDCPECRISSVCNGDVEVTFAVDCTGAVCSVHAEERRDCAQESLTCMGGTCVDPNDPGGANTPAPGSVKRVFLTSLSYSGDLARAAGTNGGLEGADALCQLEARGANLGGQWKAWLSDYHTDAIDRVTDVGPWYLVDGQTLVTNSVPQLLTQGPKVPINMVPTGDRVEVDEFDVWTGTTQTGRGTTYNCDSWTNSWRAAGYKGSGDSRVRYWTEKDSAGCEEQHRLYCFEQ